MTDPSPATARPLRADARRNRERVLDAARVAFAEEGLAVPIDEIARRAGVGAGTVYRHFPTKEALFEAVLMAHVERLIEEARSLAGAADPGAAFAGFLDRMIKHGAGNRALADALTGVGIDVHRSLSGATRDLHTALGELLTGAQAAGAIRADLTPAELRSLLHLIHLAAEREGGGPDSAARLLTIIYEGMTGQHRRGYESGRL
jgi:AcrR family transcriptional regulator